MSAAEILTEDDFIHLRRLIAVERERDRLRTRVDAVLASRKQASGKQALLDVAREHYFAARRAVRLGTATPEQQRLVDDSVARAEARKRQRGRLLSMSMTASNREVILHMAREGIPDLKHVTRL